MAADTATSPDRASRAAIAALPLSVLAVVVMNGAFLLQVADLWSRLVVAIALLGAIGVGVAWHELRSVWRANGFSIGLGLASALAMYAAAAFVTRFEPVARQAAVMGGWPTGHSLAFVVATVAIAVAGEEIFWRGVFVRKLARGLPVLQAALLAALVFAVAHLASGTWLLPVAALGAGFVWNLLYLATGNLTVSFVSHLVWDLLVVVIAPLA